ITAGIIIGRPKSGERTPLPRIIAAAAAGFLVVYVPGLIRLKAALNLEWIEAAVMGFVPFIVGDVFKGIAAVLIAPRLRRTAAGFLNGER
ncbi:MAG: biotin transporter BioY, partial [Treponema sp.]|nr:biotin transporter BioY [Treponema sp.]